MTFGQVTKKEKQVSRDCKSTSTSLWPVESEDAYVGTKMLWKSRIFQERLQDFSYMKRYPMTELLLSWIYSGFLIS